MELQIDVCTAKSGSETSIQFNVIVADRGVLESRIKVVSWNSLIPSLDEQLQAVLQKL